MPNILLLIASVASISAHLASAQEKSSTPENGSVVGFEFIAAPGSPKFSELTPPGDRGDAEARF